MLRASHGLALMVLALLVIGVVMVNSAGLSVDPDHPVTIQRIVLGSNVALAALAMGMLLLGSCIPIDRLYTARGGLSPVPWLVVAMIVALLAVHVPGLGREVNGARRWIMLGPMSFQPSELVKWALPVVIAWYCCRRTGVLRSFRAGFVPPIALACLLCGLIAMEDLGTAALIFVVCLVMLVAAGCRLSHVALLTAPALLAFAGLVASSDYRTKRVLAYLNPFDDPQGIGYHIIQSMTAVAGGGLAGRGLGNSIQKFAYLPEDTTDFIFAIVCEELGLVGALMVISIYAALLLCGLSIVKQARSGFARLLGLGILMTIGLQAAINIAVVTGLAPTKGIALPLLSKGGTGWLLTAFAVGLLISMDRTTNRLEAPSDSTPEPVDAMDDLPDFQATPSLT
ncbi:MAG: cell division protein FtsW [Phycisphaerales bacterium]|nr:cell division protein FtsW [Phycisphaerales bacterium]